MKTVIKFLVVLASLVMASCSSFPVVVPQNYVDVVSQMETQIQQDLVNNPVVTTKNQ